MTQNNENDFAALRIEREFDAPVERVYQAWTSADDLKIWWWGTMSRDVKTTVDPRVGGHFDYETHNPKEGKWRCTGEFLEVVPNTRLVYTLHWDAPMGYEAPDERVTVTFEGRGATTSVLFLHEGVPDVRSREGHRQGWNDTFNVLNKLFNQS